MLTREEVSRILLTVGAIRIPQPCSLGNGSGSRHPVHADLSALLNWPEERSAVANALTELARRRSGRVDVVASAGTVSTALASLLAERLGLPMVYVRPTPKAHGKRQQVEGVLTPGQRVVVVSDVNTSDTDLSGTVGAIERSGGEVVLQLAVLDARHDLNETFPHPDTDSVPCDFLTDLATVAEVASGCGPSSTRKGARDGGQGSIAHPSGPGRRLGTHGTPEESSRAVAKVLLEIQAVSINTNHPFRYTSGILSPIYTDNRLLISHPEPWSLVIDSFVDRIADVVGLNGFHILAGIVTSGVPHATLIADRLRKPLVAVRAPAEGDGKRGCIEGCIEPGSRVVLIEDHVTTGRSALAAAGVLREAGAVVDYCAAIFTYDEKKATAAFHGQGIDLQILCGLPVLMDVLVKMGRLEPAQQDVVFDWLEDPQGWASRRGFISG